MDVSPGFCWFLLGVMVSSVCTGSPTSKPKSCSEVRQLYNSKGYSLNGVPHTEISGEHLRVCPQGYTCCTSEMEENFASLSRRELEGKVKEAGRSIQASLNTQYKNFDGYFQEVLNRSESSLHEAFLGLYGDLYTQNTQLFKELYGELRRYYHGSNINLEEALTEFWTRLLERIFKQLNPQYQLTDEYLDCALKQAEQQRPFGETPRELKARATLAFIAVRSFIQGLSMASDVVRRVSQVPLSPECTRAIMKLLYCPHCRGMSSVKGCQNYCHNVMKGCLANQADLDTEWRAFVDAMLQVSDRFEGTSSVETVFGSIHVRISEAIFNLQENEEHIRAKVFQACGNPKANSRGSEGNEKKRMKPVSDDTSAGHRLEKLVLDVKGKLGEMKHYWVALPSALCGNKITAGPTNEDRCWNGMTKSRYLPEVMGDGLANQINNPEVDVDITKPDMMIRQQIMQLKIMTNRLRNAYKGNDIDFLDSSDDISGSGSADGCPEETCKGSRKKVILSVAGQPKVLTRPLGTGSQGGGGGMALPSALTLTLSWAVTLAHYLWR
ncbi:glypican-1 [Latimeria chalumnae]|uniref:Glypican-1 n=1 Tax=Latimeria chalumnae TaxID=7897 RepID=H2ZUW9_LATCH|nr:PREDICTED: glypican-1-like [Latimeria chalumnae]XP_014347968.1 PREDICTED: glypican-1-like [Latimeria chalumnae]XP_014347969.1 PREDICTED: glypican-1-like [Latimeria chalumnae]|eukprot:XP_006002732.1 PREDICTED: glypican-1-like [Latimeria chalumnae]